MTQLITSAQEIAKDAAALGVALAALLGTVSAICTAIAHVPGMPAAAAEAFARLGVASQKFSVNKRPGTL